MTYSALTGEGVAELWAQVLRYNERMGKTGELAGLRRAQQVKWLWSMLEDRVFSRLRTDAALRTKLPQLEAEYDRQATEQLPSSDDLAADFERYLRELDDPPG